MQYQQLNVLLCTIQNLQFHVWSKSSDDALPRYKGQPNKNPRVPYNMKVQSCIGSQIHTAYPVHMWLLDDSWVIDALQREQLKHFSWAESPSAVFFEGEIEYWSRWSSLQQIAWMHIPELCPTHWQQETCRHHDSCLGDSPENHCLYHASKLSQKVVPKCWAHHYVNSNNGEKIAKGNLQVGGWRKNIIGWKVCWLFGVNCLSPTALWSCDQYKFTVRILPALLMPHCLYTIFRYLLNKQVACDTVIACVGFRIDPALQYARVFLKPFTCISLAQDQDPDSAIQLLQQHTGSGTELEQNFELQN